MHILFALTFKRISSIWIWRLVRISWRAKNKTCHYIIQRNTCCFVPSVLCFSMKLMMAFGYKSKITQFQPTGMCSEFQQWSNMDYLSIWLFLVQCLGKHMRLDTSLHLKLCNFCSEKYTSSICLNFYFKCLSLFTQLFFNFLILLTKKVLLFFQLHFLEVRVKLRD